ncbi:glycoside hydrolase family 13 protein [Sphingobacterium suaedae]|uniref:Glycoside hydrolase family 13 protein n=1 Tax=Sphingobacterium suaedae TaxID=1686402 RepID=A0ABW5KE16_9SPHI
MEITKYVRRILCAVGVVTFSIGVLQAQSLERIEPLHWWVGMEEPSVQLVLYGKNIGRSEVKITKNGLQVLDVHRVKNPNYLFIDVSVGKDAQPGSYPIELYTNEKLVGKWDYELKARSKGVRTQGVTAADLIYLLMPDRFSNGDTKNDRLQGMRETAVNRDSMYYRHGGDLQGVINHLDYLHDLGVTALWMTPVLTNDMPQASYHGYANTENYYIDPRFGDRAIYKELSDKLHERKMKLVHDVVPNHVGLYHWTVIDKPMDDWLHEWPHFTQTSYKDQTLFDPYGSKKDKDQMEKGWFVATMPDMNQQNPFVQKYITQSHIWWIEEIGIDGFRIDTYPYNDLKFMAEWTDAIRREFPNFTFFGETWVQSVPNQAYFLGGQKVGQDIDTKLEGVTDFQLNYAIGDALNFEKDGANRLYSTLGSDYQYPLPLAHVIFLDNHDKDRFFSVVGEDMAKYKSAMTWLLTYRGIPQIYYGAEVLMKNFSRPDGLLREDFQGGFPADKQNKFMESGRTRAENEIFNHIRSLANYRKKHTVLQTGNIKHFVPEKDVYVYFRYHANDTVMVIMNLSSTTQTISSQRFIEMIDFATVATDIVSGKSGTIPESWTLPSKETLVLELK